MQLLILFAKSLTSSPVSTNSSQSDNLQVKSPILVKQTSTQKVYNC